MLAEIDKNKLDTILKKVTKIVEKKSWNPILSFVKLKFADDVLTVTASNCERSFETELFAKNKYDLETCVDASLLAKIVGRSESEFICFEFHSDNKKLVIERKNGDISLQTADTDRFPEVQVRPRENAEWVKFSRYDLLNTFKALLCGTIQEEHDQVTRIAEFTIETNLIESKFEAFSTNRNKLSLVSGLCEKSNEADKESKIVQFPIYAVQILASTLNETDEEFIYFSEDVNQLYCKISENEFYSFLKVTAQMPNIKPLLESLNPTAFFSIESKELLNKIEFVALFSDDRSKSVRFILNEGLLTLRAIDADKGEITEEIEVSANGESVTAAFNYSDLVSVLRQVEGNVKFSFTKRTENANSREFITYPTEIAGEENGIKSRFLVQSLRLL